MHQLQVSKYNRQILVQFLCSHKLTHFAVAFLKIMASLQTSGGALNPAKLDKSCFSFIFPAGCC